MNTVRALLACAALPLSGCGFPTHRQLLQEASAEYFPHAAPEEIEILSEHGTVGFIRPEVEWMISYVGNSYVCRAECRYYGGAPDTPWGSCDPDPRYIECEIIPVK